MKNSDALERIVADVEQNVEQQSELVKNAFSSLNTEMSRLRVSINEAVKDVQGIEDENKILKTERDTLQSRVNGLVNDVAARDNMLEETKEKHQQEISLKQAKFDEERFGLLDKVNSLTSELEKTNKSSSTTVESLNTAHARIKELEGQVEDLTKNSIPKSSYNSIVEELRRIGRGVTSSGSDIPRKDMMRIANAAIKNNKVEEEKEDA